MTQGPSDRDVTVEVDSFELEDCVFGGTRAFTLHGIDEHIPLDLRFNVHLETNTRLLVSTLYAHIRSSSTQERTVTVPASWWDHFKLEYFPAWALTLWPPTVRVEKITFRQLYPTLHYAGRDHRPVPYLTVVRSENLVE